MKFEEKLMNLRRKKGMSQEELCNAAGISRKAMHNIENGKCSVGIKTLYKITAVLGISVSEFFSTFNSDYEI